MRFKSDKRDPVEVAEYFAEFQFKNGYHFDFSLRSLEEDVDKYLESLDLKEEREEDNIECYLTAYIGETICRLYNGIWKGEYQPPHTTRGSNYYLCYIMIVNYKYWPSHFISYRLNHGRDGENGEGTFKEYLYSRNRSRGIFSDFLGGGLINKIKFEKRGLNNLEKVIINHNQRKNISLYKYIKNDDSIESDDKRLFMKIWKEIIKSNIWGDDDMERCRRTIEIHFDNHYLIKEKAVELIINAIISKKT